MADCFRDRAPGSRRGHSLSRPAEDGVTIDKDHEVILARYQQAVYAFSLSCPHQKTPLRWQAEDHTFRCPKHKSRFQPDGVFVDGRATRSMDRYAIRREGNEVWVSGQALPGGREP